MEFVLLGIAILFIIAIALPSKCPKCNYKNYSHNEVPTGGMEADRVIECGKCKHVY